MNMMTVKFNYPSSWNFFHNKLPALFDLPAGNIKYEINNDCTDCDVWIVWDNIDKAEKVRVPFSNTIFIAEEAYPEKKYPEIFLNQFSKVFATRDDISHPGFARTHYTGSWFVHKGYFELQRDFDIKNKKSEISVISSNLTMLEGHKKRYAFVNQLIGHFKDKLDAYGRGYHEVVDKAVGLEPYKYSIAIENSVIPDYFTEKIWDCYLSYTLPFYYGCPNIENYFPENSFIRIDINDYKKSIQIIEEAIETDQYFKSYHAINEARKLVLDYYSIIPFIQEIIKKNVADSEKQQKIIIKPIQEFSRPKSYLKRLF